MVRKAKTASMLRAYPILATGTDNTADHEPYQSFFEAHVGTNLSVILVPVEDGHFEHGLNVSDNILGIVTAN